MKVKKYHVKTISEAMEKIRMEFGDDAYILDTKKVKKGGFLGIGGEKYLEVTVLSEQNSKEENFNKETNANKNDMYNMKSMLERNKRLNDRIEKNKKEESAESKSENAERELLDFIRAQREVSKKIDHSADSFYRNTAEYDDKKTTYSEIGKEKNNFKEEKTNKDIDELKKMIYSLNNKIDGSAQNRNDLKMALKNIDLDDNLINDFFEKIKNIKIEDDWKNDNQIRNIFSELLKNSFSKREEFFKGKVMLVGATGVGKTTTIAKLAAMEKKNNKKVAIVTIDTYRIAAADQLKIYADIMGIPAQVCYTPKDLKITLESLVDYDVIFIDTAGRSHKNDLQLGELKVFIDTIKPDIKLLLLNSNTRTKDLINIYEKFSIANPNGIIFTKIDETSSYGQMFSVLNNSKVPVFFITDGQKVPDDIKRFDAAAYIEVLLEEVFQ
jgi:flagellar biosynthesis protein FlhF